MEESTSALHRTPAVKFTDIPGELPEGNIPEDIDRDICAAWAVAQLNDLKPEHFTTNAQWRDLLALTHTFRSFYSSELVCKELQALSTRSQVKKFERATSKPRFSVNWLDVDFTFNVQHRDLDGSASGILSVLQCPDGVWRIWLVRTWLECFEGHGHPDRARLPEHANGTATDESAKLLGAIIIGGGQAGLSTAGRLQALGVSYALFEKTAKVGDVWRNRYHSLMIHTPKEFGPLPLGSRFPSDEPNMMPASRLAHAYEVWAKDNKINIHLRTTVDSASYHDETQIWTVVVSGPDGQCTFTAKNLVMAVGPGSTQPVSPSWATTDNIKASGFQGEVLHGMQWQSAKPYRGKRGIVVGCANTGTDIACDMADAGMQPTIVQRGKTFVLPVEWLHGGFAADYHVDKPTALADRETTTYPNKVARDMVNRAVHGLVKMNEERFDALEKTGFKVDRYGDLFSYLLERFGGHIIDHGQAGRIAKGDIKVKSQPVKGFCAEGLEFDDGSRVPADVVVMATGYNHDFRSHAAKIIGQHSAERMDDFGGLDEEGEMRGFARFSGRTLFYPARVALRGMKVMLTAVHTDPNLYYHGFELRGCRFYSQFIALAVQADALGRPLQPYTATT